MFLFNKCIEDDTKAAAPEAKTSSEKKTKIIKYGEERFSIWRMEFFHHVMWHVAWDHEFARWQHPAMWHLALGWHAIEFAKTFSILEFYFRFRFWSCHRSRHVILYQYAKFYPNPGGWNSFCPRQKNDVMSIFKMTLRVRWWVLIKAHVRLPIGRQ